MRAGHTKNKPKVVHFNSCGSCSFEGCDDVAFEGCDDDELLLLFAPFLRQAFETRNKGVFHILIFQTAFWQKEKIIFVWMCS